MGTNYFVYILKCKDNTLYTGFTTDVTRRIEQHEVGLGAKYTRGRGPFELLHIERFSEKSAALKREREIKRWSRVRKLKYIEVKKEESSDANSK